jgi:hypothetical protein
MHNVVAMAICYGREHLLNDLGCVLLIELGFRCDLIEQLSSRAQSKDI